MLDLFGASSLKMILSSSIRYITSKLIAMKALSFKSVTSLMINLLKSSIAGMNIEEQDAQRLVELFNCKQSRLPFVCLGS